MLDSSPDKMYNSHLTDLLFSGGWEVNWGPLAVGCMQVSFGLRELHYSQKSQPQPILTNNLSAQVKQLVSNTTLL